MLRVNKINKIQILAIVFLLLCFCQSSSGIEKKSTPKFKAVAFYTGINDAAHVSFVHESNRWFTRMAAKYNFSYDSTNNWENMNAEFLSHYQVVIFLDTRPDSADQRAAFKKYMESGGAWMGFHFCAFALTPSAYPQNWDWYHKVFLGSGQYKSNIWGPTTAVFPSALDQNLMKYGIVDITL